MITVKRILYLIFSVTGISLMVASLTFYRPSPFVQFNWLGLLGVFGAAMAFPLSRKFPRFSRYFLFAMGLFLMLNTHFYFKECSISKGLEVFGGFFISIASIF